MHLCECTIMRYSKLWHLLNTTLSVGQAHIYTLAYVCVCVWVCAKDHRSASRPNCLFYGLAKQIHAKMKIIFNNYAKAYERK